MSLPAFSTIIASYVPNHGNLGPSGSYNAWVNKINKRKDRCNSIACTNTPDDIWNVKFDECDEGCSAQGDDKCVSNFCDALADVYDYTRRLQSSDTTNSRQLQSSDADLETFEAFIADKIAPRWHDLTQYSDYNAWIQAFRGKDSDRVPGEVSDLLDPFAGCDTGCRKQRGGTTLLCGGTENSFCKALTDFTNPTRYEAATGEQNFASYDPASYTQALQETRMQEYVAALQAAANAGDEKAQLELENADSLGVAMTQGNVNYVVCSVASNGPAGWDAVIRERACRQAYPKGYPGDTSCAHGTSCSSVSWTELPLSLL